MTDFSNETVKYIADYFGHLFLITLRSKVLEYKKNKRLMETGMWWDYISNDAVVDYEWKECLIQDMIYMDKALQFPLPPYSCVNCAQKYSNCFIFRKVVR